MKNVRWKQKYRKKENRRAEDCMEEMSDKKTNTRTIIKMDGKLNRVGRWCDHSTKYSKQKSTYLSNHQVWSRSFNFKNIVISVQSTNQIKHYIYKAEFIFGSAKYQLISMTDMNF